MQNIKGAFMNPFRRKEKVSFKPTETDKKKIVCTDCAYQAESTVDPNDQTLEYCEKYPYPRSKPRSILMNYAFCPFYLQRKDAETGSSR